MKFSMIFEGVDRASKVMKKIMATEKKAAAAVKGNSAKAARAATKVQRNNSALARSMNTVKRSSVVAFQAISKGAAKAGRSIKSLHQKTVALAKNGFGSLKQGAGKIGRGVAIATGLLASIYGGAALAAGSMTDVASQFEKFQTILETTEGSSAKAKNAMAWVADFAVKTPYELDKVMDSFVRMRANGLDPTNGSLKTLGDTAAAMGKPLMQAVEAMADAVTGENERLKEFGIVASKTGKIISYEYTNALGKTVTASVKAGDRLAIQQTLMKIWGEKYGGAMEKLSQTWAGMVSNMADLWQKFQLMVMNAGLFDWMKEKLRFVLDTISQMEADGSLKQWATQIGQSIQTALESAWTMATRIVEIGSQVGDFLSKAADWAGGWDNLAIALGAIAFAPTLVATAQGIIMIAKGITLLSAALIANPIGLAIAAIAGGVYLIYANWDAVKPYFEAIWNGIKTAAETAWNWIKTAFSWTPLGIIVQNWSGISDALAAPIKAGQNLVAAAWDRIKATFAGNWTPSFGNWSFPTLDTSGLESAWQTVKSTFDGWSPDFTSWEMPTLKTASLVTSWETVKGLFNWSPLEALDRTFGGIPAKIGGLLNEAADIAGNAWSRLKNVFSDEAAVDIAARDPASIERATVATNKLQGALTGVRSVDLSGVSNAISKLMAEASGLLDAVKQSVSRAQSFLSGVSFHHHGVRLMETLAAGMRARAQVVVAQIKATMQEVRNHLPSSPAKVGPLSDIHKLKFGETIASSIKADPMVKAMRAAAAATMLAAQPALSYPAAADQAFGALKNASLAANLPSVAVTPSIAAQSTLATPTAARSVVAAKEARPSASGGGSAPVSITYNPTITISGDAKSAEGNFRKMLQEHKRDIKRMVDEEVRRESRRKH